MKRPGGTRSNRAAPARASDARLALALTAIRLRDKRDELLGGELFADPAWDILLDLYVAHLKGRAVSVSDVCIGARVPQTTALRWVEKLHRDGVVQRTRDPGDARRVYLSLDPDHSERLERLFDWLSAALDEPGDRENRSSSSPSEV